MRGGVKVTVEESLRLLEEGAIAEAVALCETLRDDPDQGSDALHILGVAAAHEGEVERALELLGQAVNSDPDNIERRLNFGMMALDLGCFEIAVSELSHISSAVPDDPLPQTLLGNALAKAGRYEEAVAAQERAVSLVPGHPALWSNLASAYLAWGKVEAADAGNEHAVKLDPEDAELQFNLGGTRVMRGREEEALKCFQRALELNPGHARARTSLGVVQRSMGDLEGGLAEQEQAYFSDPHDIDVRWNLAVSHLFHGQWATGWRHYEARRERAPQLGREGFGVRWGGEARPGETVVIEREQGLGDSLMFARFLESAAKRVGRIIFRCQEGLCPLLRDGLLAEGVEIMPFEDLPYAGLYAPIGSLPHLLEVGGGLQRDSVPYLNVAKERVEAWRERLGPKTQGPRIGLAWQGNPDFPKDKRRSIPLESFRPLLDLEGVEIINLQQVHGLEQIDALPPELRPRDLGPDVDRNGMFLDTAAIMKNLDLVVTSDSATVHLAGALGVETVLVLCDFPDWRWGQGPEIWYPTVHAQAQLEPGAWSHPVNQVVEYVRTRFMVG